MDIKEEEVFNLITKSYTTLTIFFNSQFLWYLLEGEFYLNSFATIQAYSKSSQEYKKCAKALIWYMGGFKENK